MREETTKDDKTMLVLNKTLKLAKRESTLIKSKLKVNESVPNNNNNNNGHKPQLNKTKTRVKSASPNKIESKRPNDGASKALNRTNKKTNTSINTSNDQPKAAGPHQPISRRLQSSLGLVLRASERKRSLSLNKKSSRKRDSVSQDTNTNDSQEAKEAQAAKELNQLDKRQRFDIYIKSLSAKPAATCTQEAIELLNKTLDEVEEKFAPKKDDKVFNINSKKWGRMYPVPDDRIRVNRETGKTEMLTTGLTIIIELDGGFDIWTIQRGNFEPKKLFHKDGVKLKKATVVEQEKESESGDEKVET
jgi:hypothetical protein